MKKHHSARELFEKVKPSWEKYDLKKAEPYLKGLSDGARNDIENKSEVGYYQFLPCLISYLKPRQIVELGGAMGASALMMLSALPTTSKLFSITLEEDGLEYSFVKEKYHNFVPIVGDGLDLKSWSSTLNLGETDLWFIDTKHEESQLKAEIELYKPFFKKGSVILLDDIKINEGMFRVWIDLNVDKFDATTWLHHSGFGIIVL